MRNAFVKALKNSFKMDFQEGYAYIHPYKKVKRMLIAKNMFIIFKFPNPMILNGIKKNMWALLKLNIFFIYLLGHLYSFINCQFMSQLFI